MGPAVDFVHVMEVGPAHEGREAGREDIFRRVVCGWAGPCWPFAGMNRCLGPNQ